MSHSRELTGRHVFFIFAGAFATIIVVNLILAVSAIWTFPGLEVENSYIASQKFNARQESQQTLGWSVDAQAKDERIYLTITEEKSGIPIQVEDLIATIGRTTHTRDDFTLNFRYDGISYVAPAMLSKGNWNIRVSARSHDGIEFTQRLQIYVLG